MQHIAIMGLGKVGSLVATMLNQAGFTVTGGDAQKREFPFDTENVDVSDEAALKAFLSDKDAVVSCLPYHLNQPVAQAAYDNGIHYFDLTEDVPTTNAIREMAKDSQGIMAPQCGLAPGYIGIIGSHLTKKFTSLRDIELRVGALPRHPSGLLGYAFNWSAEGVVNEYLNDCEVIKQGERKMVPAMQEIETIFIDGIQLEAFSTSGGLGTMCETFEGQVDLLNYKTMRYPGHCKLMRFFFNELLMKEKREEAGKILIDAKPPVNDDVVYVHAAVEGYINDDMAKNDSAAIEGKGRVWREEFVRAYTPKNIAGQEWRAISWTTAASVVSVVEMVANGALQTKGFLKQEDIPLLQFLSTKTGKLYGEVLV